MQENCVRISGVTKNYRERNVIKDTTLQIPYGKIFGLLGPSGAGKSTLVRMIVGIERPTKGSIYVLDQKMPDLKTVAKIGYMAQADALYSELTAYQNLVFFGSLFALEGKQLIQRIDEVMDLVALKKDLHKKVSMYSGGMKRRLSLATALLHKPKLLILDEPTVGIDPALRKKIWNQFVALRESGTTIIVTTHVMDEASYCDLLGLVRDGQLIANGSPDELMKSVGVHSIEEVFLAYGGDEK
jgi:ABC-2 type transport system ATP-binding protein